MSNRIYNVLFHTHTVSGLVISVALYVIFFAGSISFFRDDIIAWERNRPIVAHSQMNADFDQILDTLAMRYGELRGRTINIRQSHQERNVIINISSTQDTSASENARRSVYTYLDTRTYEESSYYSGYTLGEFIYRLHFFAQIPYPYGYLFSGFVAFFFLFAIVTGLIVHWKKMVSNFYLFRPWARLKTVWTDAHTALGLIGLPFQFIFSVTGAVLIIGTTIMLGPASSLIYDKDRDLMYRELLDQPPAPAFANHPVDFDLSLNELVNESQAAWGDVVLSRLCIQNFGDENMNILVEVRPQTKSALLGLGRATFDWSGSLTAQTSDESVNYIVGADQLMRRLHFGDFGGYGLKIIYFVFGIITCFVILSGVLLWVEARDKRSTAPWKRTANQWVASIFMAISLSMYPAMALLFSIVRLAHDPGSPTPHVFIYKVFFTSWLILSVCFAAWRNNYLTNKYCLFLGSIFGMAIPIVNGLVTGNWMWDTYNEEQLQIFVVDAFWLITSLIALLVFFRLKKVQPSNGQESETRIEGRKLAGARMF
ncbi:MAG: PepSY-associated TM helix domain-containing protein [Marinoscillum sp.]|uniref:PepSY-associated TM helix domain-containing protein n=1 Tax=Marinoscillum sp. TaxID=2024838 RepID=UPI0032F3BD55